MYGEALANPLVAGVVVGTRPDCVDDAVLDYFAELARTCYVAVEYGIESCYDETLRAVNRGHDSTAHAVLWRRLPHAEYMSGRISFSGCRARPTG